MTSACARCRATVAARKRVVPTASEPQHEHAGYEIFFEPEVNGWRYRGADATPSALSYRSAFLARKAVDELGSEPAAAGGKSAKGRKGRS